MAMSNAELQRRVEQNKNDAEEFYEILKAHTLRFDGVDKRFDGVDKRFDGVDKRFDGMDKRFDGVDKRLDGIEVKLDTVIEILTER
ncbi:hypothetical protein ACW5CM_11645 [Microbacterium sp. A588]